MNSPNGPSSFAIRPATRAGVKPLVGFYGKSGSGKTMSALLLARGIVGPSGKIVLVDSENKRGSIFADIIPGGYNVIDLDEPFTPDRYAQAIAEADKNADATVVDSFSHEWYGPGGVLEMQEAELDRMAGDDWKKREACKMAAWIKPKTQHKGMVNRLLRCKGALIVCMRGEEKTHMQKGDDNKMKVITDEFSSPITDPRFVFEMLLNFETVARISLKTQKMEGGFVIPRKVTHPDIYKLLPAEQEQIGTKHGEALARWCLGQAPDEKKRLLGELRDLTASIHGWNRADGAAGWEQCKEKLNRWLTDELGIQSILSAQSEQELRDTLAAARAKLNKPKTQSQSLL